ncbi:MAG: CBS domain-containing protein [Nitrososphaerota archaeon]|jgi:predicted transcriptional regulator|nr:CBS domain-containing protein [Nitrososphaerota archaeon]
MGKFTVSTMYLPDLEDLQRLMLSHSIKSTELAKTSGINKGTISRILRKKVEPSYTTMKRLFEAVYAISSAKEKVVAEVMTRKVVTAKEDETIYSVKKKMLDGKLSQLPVLSNDNVIGMVTEGSLLANPKATKAKDALTYDYLVVDPQRSTAGLREVMLDFQAILVLQDGKLRGILTKSDFL